MRRATTVERGLTIFIYAATGVLILLFTLDWNTEFAMTPLLFTCLFVPAFLATVVLLILSQRNNPKPKQK